MCCFDLLLITLSFLSAVQLTLSWQIIYFYCKIGNRLWHRHTNFFIRSTVASFTNIFWNCMRNWICCVRVIMSDFWTVWDLKSFCFIMVFLNCLFCLSIFYFWLQSRISCNTTSSWRWRLTWMVLLQVFLFPIFFSLVYGRRHNPCTLCWL